MALPRYGTGDEVAAMVVCLAGLEAGYLTGASRTIDGGLTAGRNWLGDSVTTPLRMSRDDYGSFLPSHAEAEIVRV